MVTTFSPLPTRSPADFSQPVTVTDSTSPRLGMMTGCFTPASRVSVDGRAGLAGDRGAGGRYDLFGRRDDRPFEYRRERNMDTVRADAKDRALQHVEEALLDLRRHLRAEAAEGPRLVADDRPARLGHGPGDRLEVERHDGAKVDKLGVDAFLGEDFAGFRRVHRLHRIGDDG